MFLLMSKYVDIIWRIVGLADIQPKLIKIKSAKVSMQQWTWMSQRNECQWEVLAL